MSCSPGDNQGVRGLLPTVCAYSFSVCKIQISQVCYSYVGLGPKLHTCILFTVYQHYMIMNAVRYYLFSVQVNQYFYSVSVKSVFIINTSSASIVYFVSINISRFSFSYFFLTYYLLSFVAYLVLFTIPSSSKGVPVVGPSSSVQQCVCVESLKTKDVWESVSLLVQIYYFS